MKYTFLCTKTSMIDDWHNPEKSPHTEAYWDETKQAWLISFKDMDDFFDFIHNRIGKDKDDDDVSSFVVHNEYFGHPELEIYDDRRE